MKFYTTLTFSLLLLSLSINTYSQQVVNLWEGKEPNKSQVLAPDGNWVEDNSVAELHIYLPPKAINTGMAVLICPGGSYEGLAFQHEGIQVAQWLNEQGIAGCVLKYRMPHGIKNIPLDDAHQAMRYLRQQARSLGLDDNKIGVAGFSAGGHLASTLSTHFASEGISIRPSFSILVYPVITMGEETHQGSKDHLLGSNPSTTDVYRYSNELQVNTNTPPSLLLLTDDDTVVPAINSIKYYEALKKNNIPAAMYIFPVGGHGWGMNADFKYKAEMQSLLKAWLESINNK